MRGRGLEIPKNGWDNVSPAPKNLWFKTCTSLFLWRWIWTKMWMKKRHPHYLHLQDWNGQRICNSVKVVLHINHPFAASHDPSALAGMFNEHCSFCFLKIYWGFDFHNSIWRAALFLSEIFGRGSTENKRICWQIPNKKGRRQLTWQIWI